MELIERYLQAVKFWLPKQQKLDIIAELSDDIQAQIEEQELTLGRKLNEAEVGALLKQRGRPVLVANRYLPQESLIGPVLFPMYRFVLKIVLLCYLVPWVLVWVSLISFSPDFHAGHIVGSMWGSLWFTAFVATGVVTIIFAILERAQAKSRFLEAWDPRKLPSVRNPDLIPRSTSSVALGVNLVAFIWWASNMSSPIILDHSNLRVSLAPLWSYFFWGALLMTAADTAIAVVDLMRPYWTLWRATLRLVADLAGSALFCWLLKANILSGITAVNVSPERALQITNTINLWMTRAFPVAVTVGALILCFDVYRVVRLKEAIIRPAPQPT